MENKQLMYQLKLSRKINRKLHKMENLNQAIKIERFWQRFIYINAKSSYRYINMVLFIAFVIAIIGSFLFLKSVMLFPEIPSSDVSEGMKMVASDFLVSFSFLVFDAVAIAVLLPVFFALGTLSIHLGLIDVSDTNIYKTHLTLEQAVLQLQTELDQSETNQILF